MKEKLHGLDLFSGIGGNSIGLGEYINTLAYCEQNPYAQHVLLSRMSEGLLQQRPIWDDIITLNGSSLPPIDIIVGGFPCQDISVAGKGAGLAGKRSGLFYEVIRLTEEIRPAFVFLENVPAIRTRGLREVIRTFTDIGYDCRWTCVSAAEIGAHHLRKRWFLLAHTKNSGSIRSIREVPSPNGEITQSKEQKDLCYESNDASQYSTSLANQDNSGSEFGAGSLGFLSFWPLEPNVGRVAHGIPHRVDRLKCLGNAVVPEQAKEAFERLMGIKK